MKLETFSKKVLELAANQSISLEVIEWYIRHYFMHKPLPIVVAGYSHVVRCSLNNPGEIFTNVRRSSYNPNKESIRLMRCNYPGQQVFYAAVPSSSAVAASTTAILETSLEHIKDHDISSHYMTLSRWSLKRKLNVFIFPFSKTSIERNGDLSIANQNFDRILYQRFGEHQKEAISYFRDSLEVISDIFCKDYDKNIYYRISSAFYNCILKFADAKGIPIDGMLYSSANTLSHGLNIVLRKEVIDDQSLVCDYLQMYDFKRDTSIPKDITFDIISEGAIPDANGNFSFKMKSQPH